MSRQITCINKTNRESRYEAISQVGGMWGKATQQEVIRHIDNNTYSYHVKVGFNDVKVIVADHNGNKYIKTEADTTLKDNLLSLPECP